MGKRAMTYTSPVTDIIVPLRKQCALAHTNMTEWVLLCLAQASAEISPCTYVISKIYTELMSQ